MAKALRCDRCKKFYEGSKENIFRTEDGIPVNSIRIGNWNSKEKKWMAIGSGYDICCDCVKEIYDVIYGESEFPKIVRKEYKNFNKTEETSEPALVAEEVSEEQKEEETKWKEVKADESDGNA